MIPRYYTEEQAAKALHREKRWLLEWLRTNQTDIYGDPLFLQVGRTRRFTGDQIVRIIDMILTEEEVRAEPEGDGLVYFIDDGDRIKIGFSRSLDRRIKQVRTSAPDAKVLLTIPGSFAIEKVLHREFADYRLAGEWFRKAPAITEYIKQRREMQNA